MSKTQLSNFMTVAGLLALILSKYGVILPAENIAFILVSIWSLCWTAYNFWQRYQKGDITLGGLRRS